MLLENKVFSWTMFVLEFVPRVLQEQARTISTIKVKWNGFYGFGLKIYKQEGKKTLTS